MRLRSIILIAVLGFLAAALLLLAVVYRATQHVPEFYRGALAGDPAVEAAAAEQMERQVSSLNDQAIREAPGTRSLRQTRSTAGWPRKRGR